jgi:hypothetical protein
MKNKTIVVDRRKWLRGDGAGWLRDGRNRRMCCLGFAMRQIGHCSAKSLTNRGMPADTERLVGGLTQEKNGYFIDTSFSNRAQKINDSDKITEKEREQKLKKLARKHGFAFKFTN